MSYYQCNIYVSLQAVSGFQWFQCKAHGPNCTKDLSKVAMYGEMICDSTAVAWLCSKAGTQMGSEIAEKHWKAFIYINYLTRCKLFKLLKCVIGFLRICFFIFQETVKVQLCRDGIEQRSSQQNGRETPISGWQSYANPRERAGKWPEHL